MSNATVEKYLAFCATPFGKEIMDKEANFLKQLLKGRERILDVGCGIGAIEERLTDLNIVGVDIDPNMINAAKDRTTNEYYLADSASLPFSNDFFDAVFFVTSLEFIQDYRPSIDEAIRVLRQGGIFIAMILNPESTYFKEHYLKKDSYFRRIQHRNPAKIAECASKYLDIKTNYFLGIAGKKIFDTEDKNLASIYVIRAQKGKHTRKLS